MQLEAALSLEIRTGRLAGPALVRDYYDGAPQLASFFPGSPWAEAAYRRKAEEIDLRFDLEARRRLAAIVRPGHGAAPDSVEALAGGDALVVTTGQQAGLFTGPLYTVYKALSAIRLARALEPVLDRRVLPLFWIASDDHDWAEVDHTYLLDPLDDLHRIELAGDAGVPVPVGERVLGAEVEQSLSRLSEVMPRTGFTPRLLEQVRDAYRPGRTMAEAFGELVSAWLGEFGLLLVDPRHPGLKRAAVPVLRRELVSAADHEARLAEQTRRLSVLGYHAQVHVLPGEANVFVETEAGRERLVRDEDRWHLKGSGRTFETGELLELLEREPRRFSPNVFLRPVVESAVLPTLAYVGGPAEVSYFAQTGGLFDAHGVGMPLVFPRFSVQLVEEKVRKVLDRFHLEPEDFRRPVHELAGRAAVEEIPDPVRDALAVLRRDWGAGFGRLLEEAVRIDPTLEGPLRSARSAGLRQLEYAEKKVASSLRRKGAVAVEQIEKAQVNLYPGGHAQERVLNALQYLARYGSGLLGEIARTMHVELEVDASARAGVGCV